MVRTSSVNFFKFSLGLTILLFAFSCKPPASKDYTPSVISPTPTPINSQIISSHVKYGEVATTSNGWQVAYDSADPVEQQVTSSGWTIEATYE